MWELDQKENWALKNWCFWTVVLEKLFESPLDCKEIKQVKPKRNQSWIFMGRTDAEAEAPVLWPPDVKGQLMEKILVLGRLKAEGEGDNRGWDGREASPTQWTWVWASSRRQWKTGKPGVLQFMRLQSRTWLSNWTDWSKKKKIHWKNSMDCVFPFMWKTVWGGEELACR